MFKQAKTFLSKYSHAWTMLYFVFYLLGFFYVENKKNVSYHIVHSSLDKYIPFCEYFIIPYFLWFSYIAIVFLYLFFKDKKSFYEYTGFLYIGMTLFIVVSIIYPNGHLLRPTSFERDNIFVKMVQFLHRIDTPTNVLPSIHVYNSIAAHLAVVHTPKLQKQKWIVRLSRILSVSIILSTVFLKQHSCVDVILGILLAICVNQLIYHSNILIKAHHFIGKLIRSDRDFSTTLTRNVHRTTEDTEI